MEVMTLFSGDTMEILKSVKVWGLFPAIIILFITVFFLRFTRQSFDVLGERFPSQRLFVKQLSVISRFILVGIGFVFMVNMILDLSGEGLSFFIALIIFGVSFSSRDLIASLMAGLILLWWRRRYRYCMEYFSGKRRWSRLTQDRKYAEKCQPSLFSDHL